MTGWDADWVASFDRTSVWSGAEIGAVAGPWVSAASDLFDGDRTADTRSDEVTGAGCADGDDGSDAFEFEALPLPEALGGEICAEGAVPSAGRDRAETEAAPSSANADDVATAVDLAG
jgi:hypothetical protein